MALSYIYGAEMGHLGECYSSTGTVSVQSTIKRTGGYALRANPTSATGYASFRQRAAGGTFAEIFKSWRFYLRIATLPSANTKIARGNLSTVPAERQWLRLNTDGTLTVGYDTSPGPTSGLALSADGQWHRIDVDYRWNAGNGLRVYVDGTLWAAHGTLTGATTDELSLGVFDSCTADLYFDDLAVDSASAVIGAGQAILLKAVSDNSIGTWVGGAGGTTNLFEALNNIPPAGLATPTNTSQIKNATSALDQQGVFNVESYTAGGVGASDTIHAVMAIANHGEAVATGTKVGGVWIASNPTQSAADRFDYGDDVGAFNGFPTNWKTGVGAVAAAPSVTKGTQPTVTISKNTASTRVGHCDFLGIYVDFTPPGTTAVGASLASTWNIRAAVGASKASTWNIRAAVGASKASTWNILTAVGASKASTWNIRAAVGASRESTWNIIGAVGRSLASTWNIREVIGASLDSTWNILTAVGANCDSTWNIRAAVGASRESTWNIIGVVGASLASSWNIREAVGASRESTWNIRAAVGSSKASTWNIVGAVGRQFDSAWNIFSALEAVGRSLASTWNIRAAVGASRASTWNIAVVVGRSLNSTWNVRELAGRAVESSWNIRQTVGAEIISAWGVGGWVGRSLPSTWNIEALQPLRPEPHRRHYKTVNTPAEQFYYRDRRYR